MAAKRYRRRKKERVGFCAFWRLVAAKLARVSMAMRRGAFVLLLLTGGTLRAESALGLALGQESEVNRVAMVGGGYDALLLRVHLIRQAKVSIEVQTFIWSNDECGRLMIYELIEAARRGVKVRIIADHMFSDQDPEIAAFLATVHPNFELKLHRPTWSRSNPTFVQ